MTAAAPLAFLIVGSIAGGLARFGLSSLVGRLVSGAFPWGTLIVNALGCLAVGVISSLGATRLSLSLEARLLLITGFCGAFTTFSALVLESMTLVRSGQGGLAAAYVALTLALGFAAFAAGAAVVRFL